MLGFALVSPPPQAPAPETRACCRWRALIPLEGQDQAQGWALGTAQQSGPAREEIASFGMDPPSQPINHHIPVERGNGVPIPTDPLEAPRPPNQPLPQPFPDFRF